MTYSELLKDPRWDKKRKKILARDDYTCQECGAKNREMHVHHFWYLKDRMPWEYKDHYLITLCWKCHEICGPYFKKSIEELIDELLKHEFHPIDVVALALFVKKNGHKFLEK